MSEREWRDKRCSGCFRACRYVDFKPWGGKKPSEVFGQMVDALKGDDDHWRYKRRSSILGRLHGEKLQAWEAMIAACPHIDEWLGVGDIVLCWGHSPFGRREVEGVVVGVVPPLTPATKILGKPKRGVRIRRKLLATTRGHESYLVQAEHDGRKILLWPPVNRIKPIL